jgi:heme/copper-type cytochrome/quinol oxidase subunit 2
MNVLEAILFGIGILVIGLLFVFSVSVYHQNRVLLRTIAQLQTNIHILGSKLEDAEKQKELERSEGFIKFISESRDWAFEYIENAQKAIKEFIINSEAIFSSQFIEQDAADSFNNLKSLLPEETDNP